MNPDAHDLLIDPAISLWEAAREMSRARVGVATVFAEVGSASIRDVDIDDALRAGADGALARVGDHMSWHATVTDPPPGPQG
jgi:hypothetical protein